MTGVLIPRLARKEKAIFQNDHHTTAETEIGIVTETETGIDLTAGRGTGIETETGTETVMGIETVIGTGIEKETEGTEIGIATAETAIIAAVEGTTTAPAVEGVILILQPALATKISRIHFATC